MRLGNNFIFEKGENWLLIEWLNIVLGHTMKWVIQQFFFLRTLFSKESKVKLLNSALQPVQPLACGHKQRWLTSRLSLSLKRTGLRKTFFWSSLLCCPLPLWDTEEQHKGEMAPWSSKGRTVQVMGDGGSNCVRRSGVTFRMLLLASGKGHDATLNGHNSLN